MSAHRSPENARRPRAPWPWRLALVFASLFATCALLEAAATWNLGAGFERGAHRGNSWKVAGRLGPAYGWSGRPRARARVVFGEVDYTIELNSEGFRDVERSLAKPAGVRRVAVLGDSVAWGWGVEQGERFSDLLEARLGPNVEVLNLACPGYGTDQQLWTLVERGLAYDPDLVLVCFVLNDVLESAELERYGMRKPRFVQAGDGSWSIEGRPVELAGSPLARALTSAWRGLVVHSAVLTLAVEGPLGPPAELEEHEAPRARKPRAPSQMDLAVLRETADALVDEHSAVRHALTLVRDACAERGIPLLMTQVAHKHDQYVYEPNVPLPEGTGPAPFRTYATQRLEEACRALGVPLVATDERLLSASRAEVRLHVGDGHPNPAAHRLVADALEPSVRALLEPD